MLGHDYLLLLWIAPRGRDSSRTASDVVDALIQVQLSGIGTSDRAMVRRAIAIAVALELQGDIFTAAAKAGLLSSASVSD